VIFLDAVSFTALSAFSFFYTGSAAGFLANLFAVLAEKDLDLFLAYS
jgi:hypothetical protein